MPKNKVVLVLLCSLLFPWLPTMAQDEFEPFVFPDKSAYPRVKHSGRRISDFIPRGWSVMGRAKGDLNGDGYDDVALVVRGNMKKFKQKNDSGPGSREFDTNPRMLLILFADPHSNGYQLKEQNCSIVSAADDPVLAEPFGKVWIRKRTLGINVGWWASAGSWLCSETTYKFVLRDNKFVLIGADKSQLDRASGDQTDYSYNFLTSKEKIVTGNFADSAPKKVKWRRLQCQSLKSLNTVPKPEQWAIAPDESL